MPQPTHRLEKRSQLLAQRMRSVSESLATQMGGHPFTEAKTRTDALDWWSQHRVDQYGAQVLRTMQPTQIAELDAALYTYINKPVIGEPDATTTG